MAIYDMNSEPNSLLRDEHKKKLQFLILQLFNNRLDSTNKL